MGKTIADGYIELRVDDSKLSADTKAKAEKVSRDFGSRLNRELKALNLDAIDLQADPTSARAAIRDTERRLKDLSRDAGTLDLQIKTERALADVARLRKQIGDLDERSVTVDADFSPARREIDRLSAQLTGLGLDPIDIDANPTEALLAIDRVQHQLRELSGDTTTVHMRLEVDSALANLGRLRSKLTGSLIEGGAEAGSGFVAQFGEKSLFLLSKLPLIGSLSPPLMAAAAAAAVPVAAFLGATISGAIIGGAGIGGVVGGMVLASKDVRVQNAFEQFTDGLQARLGAAAGSFVAPMMGAIGQLEGALNQVHLDKILRDAAQFVGPLADGVSSLIVDLGAGVEDLVHNAGPVIQVISDGIASIGEHLGDGLSLIAENGDEAADALAALFKIINGAIDTVFAVVDGLTELYGWLAKIGTALSGNPVGVMHEALVKLDPQLKDSTAGTAAFSGALQVAADNAEDLKKQQELLRPAQDAVKESQEALQHSLDILGGKNTTAARTADALKIAMDNLYGAAIRQTDANETYQASWDSLSESVKQNKATLDIHTKAGRANRDVLEQLLTGSNDLYVADINAGVSIANATKKHEARTAAVKEEARRVGLNKGATDDLIDTYGRIPGKKTTDLVLDGVNKIVSSLHDLYVFQRALADGIPVASEEIKLRGGHGPAKGGRSQFQGYAVGGLHDGLIPGRPSAVDNVLATTAGGRHIALATGEFIVNADQTAKHLTLLQAINAGFDGFAAGGLNIPVDTSTRWPFAINLDNTLVMSRAAAAAKVIPAVPAGATDQFILRVVHAAFPDLHAISTFRPGARTLTGNMSYHSMHRAVDWPPSRALAEWVNAHYKTRTRELITPWNDLNIHNGARHTYTGAVWNQHNFAGGNAHDHWALALGGLVGRNAKIPLFDTGGVLMPGVNTVYNGLGRPEPLVPAGAGNTYQITVEVPVGAHPAETGRQIVNAIQAYESSNTNRWRTAT